MSNSIPVLAVDVGYGNVKSVFKLPDGALKTTMFPSLAPAHYASTVSAHQFSTRRNNVVVRVDNTDYEVGPDVRDIITPTNQGGDLSDDFARTPNYTALLYGAIAFSGVDRIECLSLGLPVHIFNQVLTGVKASASVSVASVLKEKFTGAHMVDGREVTIDSVVVVPQPVGSLFLHKQALLASGRSTEEINLIVDIGYYSTDWVVAKGWRTIDLRCGGRRGGASEVFVLMAKEISRLKGEQFDDIGRLDESLRRQIPFTLYGEEIDLQPLIRTADHQIAEVVKKIKNSIQTTGDIQEIILTGGGASLYLDEITRSFKNKVVMLEDACFSNAKGFLIAGDAALQRSRRAD